MVQRAFRAGKIDQHVEIIFYRRQAALHRDARFAGARQLAGVAAHQAGPFALQRRAQRHAFHLQRSLN
jgi:hypothetical protein